MGASLVALFGCDTQGISSLFSGAGSYIGVNSGKDGLSAEGAITQAGYAAASAIVSGKSPDEVTAQANSAFVTNGGDITKKYGRGTVTATGSPLAVGDKVVKKW